MLITAGCELDQRENGTGFGLRVPQRQQCPWQSQASEDSCSVPREASRSACALIELAPKLLSGTSDESCRKAEVERSCG